MEENRLKPMKEGYDEKLFNSYFEKTEGLRRKLASQIDARRFGVDYDEVLSWFSVKFIHVFNKYYGTKKDEYLLGDIINSLQIFKRRITITAYNKKYSQIIVDLEDVSYLDFTENDNSDLKEGFYEEAISYLKTHLSENAYELLQAQITLPPFILKQAENLGINNHNKIPNSVFAEYFELGNSRKAINYIEDLKKEIKKGTNKAKEYFLSAQSSVRSLSIIIP